MPDFSSQDQDYPMPEGYTPRDDPDFGMVRAIDPHRHSATGEEDAEWRRNVYRGGRNDY